MTVNQNGKRGAFETYRERTPLSHRKNQTEMALGIREELNSSYHEKEKQPKKFKNQLKGENLIKIPGGRNAFNINKTLINNKSTQ